MYFTKIQIFAGWVLPVLFGITVHEWAHAFVANKCGDKTAFILGRLTINPLKHIDLFGTIIVPALFFFFGGFLFGWAKPVPINYFNLKKQRRDAILVALAGPLANFIMAFLWLLVGIIGEESFEAGVSWALAVAYMGQAGIVTNFILGFINLFPIPPFDGGRILTCLVPLKYAMAIAKLEPYGLLIFCLFLATGLVNIFINHSVFVFLKFFENIFSLPPLVM